MEFIYWLLIGLFLGGCIGFVIGLIKVDKQIQNIFNAWSKSNEDWKQLLDKIKANYEKEIEELKNENNIW